DAQRNAEAAELIRSLAGASLSESQEANVETLRLRAAEGDPASLAEAARGVAERGGADGGLAIASSLRLAMGEILAEKCVPGIRLLQRESSRRSNRWSMLC
ncbi:MAG: hypothetical protein MK095_01855, partial [Phycisphaerales bacterium]|nr:hypothetical protein [Phycisphaerales bacterium]